MEDQGEEPCVFKCAKDLGDEEIALRDGAFDRLASAFGLVAIADVEKLRRSVPA